MKSTILNALLIGCVLGGFAVAAQRDRVEVTKTYLNEGNNRTGLAVAVSSTAWTQILPSGITRRSAALHTLSTAGDTVCLSTMTTSSIVCGATTIGVHLEAGGAYIDNSEQALYGRVTDASATTVYVYGFTYLDTKDNGDLTN